MHNKTDCYLQDPTGNPKGETQMSELLFPSCSSETPKILDYAANNLIN